MWHENAGLVVSLNNSPLPTLSTKSHHHPAFFDDTEIWRAFYIKNGVFNGPIFHRLDHTGPQILEKIVQLGPNIFSLPDTIISEWSLLENALLDVGDHSLATHPKSSSIPTITWPRCPHEYGYRRTHRSPIIVLRSAMRSQEAFHSLCAVVTFILSLWTKPDGLVTAPFRSAFWGLANRFNAPIHRSWLDRFSQTQVCNITLGVRPGCFINPYTSCWGPWLVNFVRAGVQVWVVWGQDVIDRAPSLSIQPSMFYQNFLPPLEVIKSAQSLFRKNQASKLPSPFVSALEATVSFAIHPSTSSAPYVVSQNPPSPAEPPSPPSNSRQHRGETLAEFLARLAEGKKRREASETLSETQSRRDREISATQKGYSKFCTVFQWEETQGHHLRVKVDRSEVPGLWNDYPSSRRVYHSHIDEWDLCPPIPPFSETLTQQDLVEIQRYDDEVAASDDAPATLKAPLDQFAFQHSGQVDELASTVPSSQAISLKFNIVDHLRDRYGYDVYRQPTWTPNLHGEPVADVVTAKRRFLFDSSPHHATLVPAIENFCNVLVNKNIQVRNLPLGWDLSRLHLQIAGLRLSLGTDVNDARMYTISSTTVEQGHWVICLQDPTTVLQIYRNRWTTLDSIVHELVSRGIPFNTGVPDPIYPKIVENAEVYVSKGLGLRPANYRPRSDDYNAYVSARTDIFRSHLGRAALLKGGLVARLARDLVGASDVLSGPEPSTSEIVGTVDGVQLVDDRLSDYLLDVISGVYYVETAADAKIHQHLSWWPKDGVWYSSGYFTEQWSADAETWYQERLRSLESGSARLYNSTDWKSNLRRYKTPTRNFLTRNRELSDSVIDDYMSYAPSCYLLDAMS